MFVLKLVFSNIMVTTAMSMWM